MSQLQHLSSLFTYFDYIYSGNGYRWYVASSCNEEHFFACQSAEDPDDWTIGTTAGPFSLLSQETYCPEGYRFSIPQDGYRHQKVCMIYPIHLTHCSDVTHKRSQRT